MTQQNGGPAFPKLERLMNMKRHVNDDNYEAVVGGGMSLRDWFAGQLDIPWPIAERVAALWNGHEPNIEETMEVRAKLRWMEADAMLKARGKAAEAPAP